MQRLQQWQCSIAQEVDMTRIVPGILLALLTGPAHADPAAAANAAVPSSHRSILRFELKTHKRSFGSFDAVVPAGWSYDDATFTYSPPKEHLPPKDERIGFSTIRIWTTCAGTCADKDWSAIIEKKVQEYRDKGYTIERDETPATGQRLVVSKHADKRIYARFFSKEGGGRYFLCEAEIDRFAQAAEPAFVAACAGLKIHDWK